MTLDFYDQNGQDFFERTRDLDLQEWYERFLKHVPAGGHILDAGCGPGRDLKVFLERGYQMTALDGSATLCQIAEQYTGHPVQHLRFDEMDYENAFDAIWTCATLLHIPKAQLPGIFQKFIDALKPGGVWYMSFKVGEGERHMDDGRLFTYFDEPSLKTFIAQFAALQLVDFWENPDTRPEPREPWLNVIVRKNSR